MDKTFPDYMSAFAYARSKERELGLILEPEKTEEGHFVVKEKKQKPKRSSRRLVLEGNVIPEKKPDRNYYEERSAKIRAVIAKKEKALKDQQTRKANIEEQERRKKELEEHRLKVEANERKARNERAKELAERASKYREMDLDNLLAKWSTRSQNYEPDEIEVLRKIIREKGGA